VPFGLSATLKEYSLEFIFNFVFDEDSQAGDYKVI
jgi:hypothetical protein